MGEVISLDERRRARAGRGGAGPDHDGPRSPRTRSATTLWFDLSSVDTYFAAERAERAFPDLAWRPVLGGPRKTSTPSGAQQAAQRRAEVLGMPLVWPEAHPAAGRSAMRVAAFAADCEQASAFVLAACRLAFCGGFDLEDPEILAEAAAAAALPLEECLWAAGDSSRDVFMEAAGQRLLAQGCDRLPVLELGDRLFCGEHRLVEAVAAARDPRHQSAPLDWSAG